MNYYTNHEAKKYKNRAERRKNGIKTEKMPIGKYTKEELKNLLEKELKLLKNESYSETVKRQRYERLRKLVAEYEKQNGKITASKQSSLENSQDERVKAYVRQREGLASNRVYQNLNQAKSLHTKVPSESNNRMKATTQKAISAYQTQMAYSRGNTVPKARTLATVNDSAKTEKKVAKKGLLRRMFEKIFAKKQVMPKVPVKTTLSGVKMEQKAKKYHQVSATTLRNCQKEVYNEFERALRDMRNYSKEKNYRVYKNGHKVNFEPHYLL